MSTNLRTLVAVPVLLLLALAALAGCGGGGSSGETSSSIAGGSEDAPKSARGVAPSEPGGAGGSTAGDAGALSTKQAAAVTPLSRDVISTGRISLRSSSLTRARAEVLRLVTSWRGAVADEQTDSDARGRISESTMTLRVPTPTFSTAMSALAQVATVQQQSRTSKDVTTDVIDNDARVRAADRSIRQIEALLGRAKQLSDVIAIEADLARRQADLDSLRSQQAYLSDQTSLSTITVTLQRTSRAAPVEHEARGFLAGLTGGWSALRGATVVLLTAVGALLPFAVLATLLGVPLWWGVRRRAAVSGASAPARSA
jgi:hypothetical protein